MSRATASHRSSTSAEGFVGLPGKGKLLSSCKRGGDCSARVEDSRELGVLQFSAYLPKYSKIRAQVPMFLL